MNTTTPAARAGVAVKTTGTGFTQHRKPISSDWACLELLRADDTCTDAALTYAELRLSVIPNPHRRGSSPLPAVEVRHYWRRERDARVGLLVGHTFEVLAINDGPEQVEILQRLSDNCVLDSCFAQAGCTGGTLLLFASAGQPCERLGLASQGVSVVGRSGRIDVTPSDCRWLWVNVDAYSDPMDVDAVRQVLG